LRDEGEGERPLGGGKKRRRRRKEELELDLVGWRNDTHQNPLMNWSTGYHIKEQICSNDVIVMPSYVKDTSTTPSPFLGKSRGRDAGPKPHSCRGGIVLSPHAPALGALCQSLCSQCPRTHAAGRTCARYQSSTWDHRERSLPLAPPWLAKHAPHIRYLPWIGVARRLHWLLLHTALRSMHFLQTQAELVAQDAGAGVGFGSNIP
jgi:hypothetical protein